MVYCQLGAICWAIILVMVLDGDSYDHRFSTELFLELYTFWTSCNSENLGEEYQRGNCFFPLRKSYVLFMELLSFRALFGTRKYRIMELITTKLLIICMIFMYTELFENFNLHFYWMIGFHFSWRRLHGKSWVYALGLFCKQLVM